MEVYRTDIFVLKNKLKEKDSIIEYMKWEQEKKSKGILDESIVLEPSKSNVDINNELHATREVIAKVSKMLNYEKGKNTRLEMKIKMIEEQLSQCQIRSPNENMKYQNNNNHEQNKFDKVPTNIEESDEESSSDSYDDSNDSLESGIKFPDKVNYYSTGKKLSIDFNSNKEETISNFNKVATPNHTKSASVIPKLNFNSIQTKFSSENKNFEKNKCAETSKEEKMNKALEKLKGEIKKKDEKIEKLKARLSKYRNSLVSAKETIENLKKEISELKEQNEFFNTNIEIKEEDPKKFDPSTDDISNKRDYIMESYSAER